MNRGGFVAGMLGLFGFAAANTAAAAGGSVTVVDSTSYTVQPSDEVILVSNATGHAYVILPSAAGVDGKRYTVAKTNAYDAVYLCNVATTGGQTISGHTVRALAGRGESLEVVSDGANWLIVDGNQEQFVAPKEWFVGGPVFTGGDGRSARTAFLSFTDAMAAAADGDTVYVCDDYKKGDGPYLIDKAVSLIGLGNRPLLERNDLSSPTVNDAIVIVTAQNVQLVNLHIQSPAGFPGVHLLINGASRSSFRQIRVGPAFGTSTAYQSSAAAGSGVGGVGIVTNNVEGCYFEDVQIGGCSIGLGIGNEASTNEVNRMVITSCYQDIVAGLKTSNPVPNAVTMLPAPWVYGGGNGGGWTFLNFKDTNPVTRPTEGFAQLPVAELLDGSGGHTFVGCDLSEGQFQIVSVASLVNTFVRVVSAPATVFHVTGDRNMFYNPVILGAGWIIDGSHNIVDGGLIDGVLTGAGSHNRFNRVTFSQGPDLSLNMTGSDNHFSDDCSYGPVAGGGPVPGLAVLGASPKFPREEAVVPLTYGGTVTVDLRKGTHYILDIGNGSGWTLANPVDSGNVNPANIMLTKEITLELRGRKTGTAGAISLGSMWKLVNNKLTAPAAGTRMILKATFNGVHMVETGRITGIAA